jgi:hypothetical protein
MASEATNRTDWFRIGDVSPTRPGWYECGVPGGNQPALVPTRRHWDGKHWSYVVFLGDSDSATVSYKKRKNKDKHLAPIFWRGLTEQRHS